MTNRQSRSLLGFVADATTIRLSDGSINVNANTLTSSNLLPSMTVKTDESRNIISADLFLSDIKDYVPPPGGSVFNPLQEDLDANDFKINNCTNIETLEQKTQYIIADEKFTETQFSGGILVNGVISQPTEILFPNGVTLSGINTNLEVNGVISSVSNISTTSDMFCSTINADNINIPDIKDLQTKTQYQTVNTNLNSTIFNGIANASLTLSIGDAQPNLPGYNLPISRPLAPGYTMITPPATGNTLLFQLAADPLKIQNITAVLNNTTVTGLLNITSDLKVDGISTLVGGLNVNQKITLTKNIIEIQEDGVYTQAIAIGNLATTGYAFPRTNAGIPYGELRLGADNVFKWYSSSTSIFFNRNTVLGSVTQLTSPINTRISIFPLLIGEASSPSSVFTQTASGALYNNINQRTAFSMSYTCMAQIITNPANNTCIFRLIHRRIGSPAESVISAYRILIKKDIQHNISIHAVGFDMVQGDILDVSIEGNVLSTIQLDSQQVSIIAH
jgi:hypothetical protein